MGRKKFSSRRKVRKKAFFKRKWFLGLMFLGLVGLIAGYVTLVVMSKPYKEIAAAQDLDLINEIEVPNMIYDAHNREIGRMFVENRHVISVEEMPQKLIDALVAGEDSRFYSHDGVDYVGIGRAIYLNLKSGAEDSGASTLTMQLARNAFHLKEQALEEGRNKYERKAVEVFLAHRIEERYSKHEILGFYLNRVPFGSGYYGVRSASLGYFGKEPKDLEVQECASLVGCIKNPSVFSPLRSVKNNKKARDHVLNRMRIEGTITQAECNRLIALPVVTNPKPIRRGTSHFYEKVAGLVKSHLSEEQQAKGGCKIFTTIDKDVQDALERSLTRQLAEVEKREGYAHPRHKNFRAKAGKVPTYLQGAAMMVDHQTGAVLGYVGGRDFTHSQYDFIESGRKPMGTAFFPMIYAAALENGYHPASALIDEAMDNRTVMVDGVEGILGEWGNEVADPRYEGGITLSRGLEKSKIAATVRLGKRIGLRQVARVARRMGFAMPDDEKLLTRILLGTEDVSLSEAVRAYGAIANAGKSPDQLIWVTRIEDAQGNVVYPVGGQLPEVKRKSLLHESTAYLLHTMLERSLKSGSGADQFQASGLEAFNGGGKTGTTSDFGDHWFVGYNERATCAVWAGFWDGKRRAIYPEAFSKDTVMPVWISAMQALEQKTSSKAMSAPEEIVKVHVCRHSGLKGTRDCLEYVAEAEGANKYLSTVYAESFYQGNQPKGYCDVHGSAGLGVDPSAFAVNKGIHGREALEVIPVQPVAPVLLGGDPYGSEQPSFAPSHHTTAQGERGLGAVKVDQLDEADEEASLYLPRPKKLEIFE